LSATGPAKRASKQNEPRNYKPFMPVRFVISRFVCFGLGRLRRPPVALRRGRQPERLR